jgi:hypothetical protein
MTLTWSSDSSPAVNAANVVGRSFTRRAMVISPWARDVDSPQRQATQSAGERIPNCAHDPSSSTQAINLTSRPAVALASPQASANSAST